MSKLLGDVSYCDGRLYLKNEDDGTSVLIVIGQFVVFHGQVWRVIFCTFVIFFVPLLLAGLWVKFSTF